MNENQISYLAGIFDGEGTVCIANRRRKRGKEIKAPEPSHLLIVITNTHRGLIVWIHELLGFGSVTHHRGSFDKHGVRHADHWKWYAYSDGAIRFLDMVEPYLIVKKPTVPIARKFHATKLNKHRPHPGKIGMAPTPQEVIRIRLGLIEELKSVIRFHKAYT